MNSVSAEHLRHHPATTLLDVRLKEDYEACRLPNAVSNCVFEVKFAERLPEMAPDKEAPCVVYGANGKSREARMAVEKMERLGYKRVSLLEGGLEAWKESGNFIEGTGATPSAPSVKDGKHELDLEESRILWTGRNLLNSHAGSIGIKSGEIRMSGGELKGGRVTIDMEAISCTDLEGEMREGLITHLKSDDFFDVERFPEAVLEIKSSRRLENVAPGGQNLIVKADLTMKGITAAVEMGAIAGVAPDGRLAAQASFLIDRTVWDVIYGSGKFFQRLGMHLVNDLVDVEVKVVTKAG